MAETIELKDIAVQIAEIGKQTDAAVKSATEIINKNVDEKIEASKKELTESTSLEVKAVKDEQDKQKEAIKEIKSRLGTQGMAPGEYKELDFGQLLAKGMEEHQDDFQKFVKKEKKSFILDLSEIATKAVGDMSFAVNFGTAANVNSTLRPGILTNPSRKVHIRDLVPIGTMTGSSFHYVKESGDGEGAITTVAEGAAKPQIDFDLVEATANAEYIAGWLRISKKMLADVLGMTAFLQARLPEKLLRVEDAQLLNGDGTAPNISGITDTGNFTAASGAGTIDVEQLIQAISQLEELDREANGIVVRPSDYWAMTLLKDSQNAYTLPNVVTVDANGTLRVAGIPVTRTTAMTVDKFIVGDFRMGAMLLIREAPVIEFFEQDSTNVRENKITVRIEERVAFPIFGSDYFIYGDFGNVA